MKFTPASWRRPAPVMSGCDRAVVRTLANRGWPGYGRPENSPAAVRAALRTGAHGVVVDVRVTRDGIPVCLRDQRLRPVGDAPVDIADIDFAELAGLVLPDDRRIARVDEVVLAARQRGSLVLDVRSDRSPGGRPLRAAVALAASLAAALRPEDDVTIASFDPRVLGLFSRELPAVRRALLCDAWQSPAACLHRVQAHRHHEVFAHLRSVLGRPAVVEQARESGVSIVCWPVNRPVDARLLDVAGVGAVVTDHPRLLDPSHRGTAAAHR